MASWLLKTEPNSYSFADLARERRTVWDGISNPAALKNLRVAAVGDTCVVYHTGGEKAAVGLARVARAAYGEPPVIDLAADRALARPVPLAELKADEAFAGSPLVRQGRLSFVPLTDAQLAVILRRGG